MSMYPAMVPLGVSLGLVALNAVRAMFRRSPADGDVNNVFRYNISDKIAVWIGFAIVVTFPLWSTMTVDNSIYLSTSDIINAYTFSDFTKGAGIQFTAMDKYAIFFLILFLVSYFVIYVYELHININNGCLTYGAVFESEIKFEQIKRAYVKLTPKGALICVVKYNKHSMLVVPEGMDPKLFLASLTKFYDTWRSVDPSRPPLPTTEK